MARIYYFLVSLITPATQDLFLSEDCLRKLGEARGKSDLLRKVVLESLYCINTMFNALICLLKALKTRVVAVNLRW